MLPIIKSGILAASREIATVSNNISNASSTGYKRSSNVFTDVYANTVDQVQRSTTGMGSRNEANRIDHSQGSLKTTNMALDLGVSGNGMFMSLDPNDGGTYFTRDGSMTLNENGQITTNNGRLLMSTNGQPLTVPFAVLDGDGQRQMLDSISISQKGQVVAQYGTSTRVDAGQIGLARFRNMNGLQQLGLNEFRETALSGAAVVGAPGNGPYGQIIQGSIEASNSDVSDEMVMMMRAQQAFSASSRMMQTEADIIGRFM
jgi:flagellar hook protein FlgE